jgi:hypothetical protein
LKTALIDRKTKLPDNLEVQWTSETEFECTDQREAGPKRRIAADD